MDLIKLLDVANPKKTKDTINLLIQNYENFGDEVRSIAQTAEDASQNALLISQDASKVAANAEANSTSAKQTAEEALAIIESADARSQAATETAEQALDNANTAIETSELAMNVATEAKSTVDQAVSTGVFGTFVHNSSGVSLLHAYMTHNLNQQDTEENFYVATPKLVRDALMDYYNKTTIDELELELSEATQAVATDLDNKPGLIVTDTSTGYIGEIFNGYTTNIASGNYSHAEGGGYYETENVGTTASGFASHAEGALTTASGTCSHAGGFYTIADQSNQTAIGEYNKSGQTGALFSVGNGETTQDRSTAFEVFKDGHAEVQGDLTVNGININTELTYLANDIEAVSNRVTAIEEDETILHSTDTLILNGGNA